MTLLQERPLVNYVHSINTVTVRSRLFKTKLKKNYTNSGLIINRGAHIIVASVAGAL